MFTVLYRWTIKPGMEKQFEKAWADRTREIIAEFGSRGSRLHRGEDGAYIAYAQWPSREAYEEAGKIPLRDIPSRAQMTEATEEVQTVCYMEVVNDLLVKE